MPHVDVESRIPVPLQAVWDLMVDIESFPAFMESVQDVRIDSRDGDVRQSSWSVVLKGSILQWTEIERVDHRAHRIEFHQVDGDLSVFEGSWSTSREAGMTVVRLECEFEVGIPLLADMLNPVAVRALRANQEQMLDALEGRLEGTA